MQFKIDRIHEAELLETTYIIPADFDVEAYLGDTWGIMRGAARKTEQVELLFEPEAGRWVAEETWHKSQQSEVLPDGRVRVSFCVGIMLEMAIWLLYQAIRRTLPLGIGRFLIRLDINHSFALTHRPGEKR